MRTQYPQHESGVTRGLSPRLWNNMPLDQIFGGPNALDVGYGIYDDFISFGVPVVATDTQTGPNGLQVYADDNQLIDQKSGWVAGATGQANGHGVLRLFTTTDNSECSAQYGGLLGSVFNLSDTAGSCKKFAMEVRFQISTITTLDCAWFIGLAEEGSAIADFLVDNEAGLVATKDLIGLYKPAANTTGVDLVYQAASVAMNEHSGDYQTLAITTWYKFGMLFEPTNVLDSSGNQVCSVKQFWNGVEQTDDVIAHSDIKATAADFPDGEEMHVIFGQKSGSAGGDCELLIGCCDGNQYRHRLDLRGPGRGRWIVFVTCL